MKSSPELYGRVRHVVMIQGLSQQIEAARSFEIDPLTAFRKMLSYSPATGLCPDAASDVRS